MGKYTEAFDMVEVDGHSSDNSGPSRKLLWWLLAFFRLLFKALDEIIARLDRIENATKPRARIDDGYKGGAPDVKATYEEGG